jgi:hypothetical protein
MIHRCPSHVHLVLELLVARDDFLSTRGVAGELRLTYNQALAALTHLRNHRAVDCVVQPDGVAWWFATPGYDDRLRTIDERKEHITKNRPAGRYPRGPRRKKARLE